MKLVTVMIPTRKRLGKLRATLEKLHASKTSENFDTIVMMDLDDAETIAAIPEIEAHPNTRVITGPRLGYSELDIGYFARMERESESEFVWIGGDDMLVDGDWYGELDKVPRTGFIVQPEISKLGFSTYPRAHAQAFPIFPKFCWKAVSEFFPRPFDTHGDFLLKKAGWKTWFLEGVTMWHDRPSHAEIQEHRK